MAPPSWTAAAPANGKTEARDAQQGVARRSGFENGYVIKSGVAKATHYKDTTRNILAAAGNWLPGGGKVAAAA
jgi:hypothetical protein